MTIPELIVKRGERLLIISLILGVIPIFIYEPELNKHFYFSGKYLSAPIAIAFIGMAYYYSKEFISLVGIKKLIFVTTFCIPFYILMGGGYVLWVNCLIPPQGTIVYSGTIVKKSKPRRERYGREITVVINIPDKEENVEVEINEHQYNSIKIGDHFSKRMKLGSLKIAYIKK